MERSGGVHWRGQGGNRLRHAVGTPLVPLLTVEEVGALSAIAPVDVHERGKGHASRVGSCLERVLDAFLGLNE